METTWMRSDHETEDKQIVYATYMAFQSFEYVASFYPLEILLLAFIIFELCSNFMGNMTCVKKTLIHLIDKIMILWLILLVLQ